MNEKEFTELVVKPTIESIQKLLVVKGGEYAGSEDRLANFKRGAQLTGTLPIQVLFIYLAKHYDAITTYIRDTATGKVRPRSEPIDGRIDDCINYLILLKGLIAESRNSPYMESAGAEEKLLNFNTKYKQIYSADNYAIKILENINSLKLIAKKWGYADPYGDSILELPNDWAWRNTHIVCASENSLKNFLDRYAIDRKYRDIKYQYEGGAILIEPAQLIPALVQILYPRLPGVEGVTR